MKKDIKEALNQIHLSNSYVPDGMPSMFYQELWSVVGEDVSVAYLRFLSETEDSSLHNSTLITLISKCNELERVSKFKSITLCNILYKIITKCINRMKPIMPEIIYKSQNVFVPGRLILQLWHLKPCIL